MYLEACEIAAWKLAILAWKDSIVSVGLYLNLRNSVVESEITSVENKGVYNTINLKNRIANDKNSKDDYLGDCKNRLSFASFLKELFIKYCV